MSVTIDSIARVGPRTWRIDYSSTLSDPLFRIYKAGELVAETRRTSYRIAVGEDATPVIEVLDTADDPSPVFPGRLVLSWQRLADAAEYRVEKDNGGAWVAKRTIPDDGREYYLWRSAFLADATTHTYRVVPVDAAGNDGTAITFAALMVRNPDPPSVSYSYDEGTGDVTIAAA